MTRWHVVILALLFSLSVYVGYRLYEGWHCRGGLYCGCPGVGGCNE